MNHILFAAWLALLAAAIALSIAVAIDDVLPGELRLVRQVQTWGVLGGTTADVVRSLTTTQVVAVVGAAAAIALWLAGDREGALAMAIAVILLSVVQPALKEIIDRPRPSEGLVDRRGSVTSASFPAGHVMSPTAVYGTLAVLSVRRPFVPPMLQVAIVGATGVLLVASGLVNLYLGVHWPSDVLGGYAWGGVVAGVALATAALAFRRFASKSRQT